MYEKIFKIFGKVLHSETAKVEQSKMLSLSLKLGYFVPISCCYEWLYKYFQTLDVNYNSTFYQKWNDITSKTRFELFVDQVKHYASTYGTDFQGKIWLPERSNLPEFPYKELKVIQQFETFEDFQNEFLKMYYSNIAMNPETLNCLIDVKNEFSIKVNIDSIKNRELKLRSIDDNYKFTDGQECLLYLLWKWCNISMLVKNKETLSIITRCLLGENIVPYLTKNAAILSSVFFRNKNVFMAIKVAGFAHSINRIRKLANKNHKPMNVKLLYQLSSKDREKFYNKASIFKLVQLYNAFNNPSGFYVIRNGKAFFKEASRKWYFNLVNELFNAIISKVRSKFPNGVNVKFHEEITLAMPTSEKNFIGELPLGSYIDVNYDDLMVGVYWENKWGARDLDLHGRTLNGESIGWNSSYGNRDITFSGDMTNADPSATEIFYIKKMTEPIVISLNEYNGGSKYSYRFFVASEKASNFDRNYMVDPRNVKFQTTINSDKGEQTIGFINSNNQFVFTNLSTGNSRIPNRSLQQLMIEYLANYKYLTVNEVLKASNISPVTTEEECEYDLSTKSGLISFFS